MKKHTSEPAPGQQSKTPSWPFAQPAQRLPDLREKFPPNPPWFLATYHGTLHLDTQQGVQDFIRFHFALMEWVQNGGYTYVASVREQLRCSDPLRTPTDSDGLRLVMSESETIDFLKTVIRGAKAEEV